MLDFETITVENRDGPARLCIVVVAYNRAEPLARLLSSIGQAEYDGENVDLIVSVDGSDKSDEIAAQCRKFDWAHGRYTIRRYLKNQGLRRHVLACGDLSEGYEAVVVLEDDLIVSNQFCRFVRAAVSFYSDDDRVAGISLYAPKYNEMADMPFEPDVGRGSVYALQSAQSWGQVWTKSMWREFRRWYERSPECLEVAADMPARIYSWPETSWKKFAMKFLAQSGKLWVYPYVSHSSNFSELGSHNRVPTALYQVLLDNVAREYVFEPLDNLVSYDIFFERSEVQLAPYLDTCDEPLVVDLYGTRPRAVGPCRLVTRRRLGRLPTQTYGLALRPHEASVVHRCDGEALAEYRIEAGECIELTDLPLCDVVPFHSNLQWREALRFGLRGLKQAVMRRLPG